MLRGGLLLLWLWLLGKYWPAWLMQRPLLVLLDGAVLAALLLL